MGFIELTNTGGRKDPRFLVDPKYIVAVQLSAYGHTLIYLKTHIIEVEETIDEVIRLIESKRS